MIMVFEHTERVRIQAELATLNNLLRLPYRDSVTAKIIEWHGHFVKAIKPVENVEPIIREHIEILRQILVDPITGAPLEKISYVQRGSDVVCGRRALLYYMHERPSEWEFSCWEEHGGGSVPYITRYLWDQFRIRQALISDITWVTEGVKAGQGVAVSLRDSGLPRRLFTKRICSILSEHQVPYQIEVESAGGSDGNELQRQPYSIDWCFIGASEEFVHSPDEKVHKVDIASMIEAYTVLMKAL
jgi:hypothetical protein